MEKCEQGKPIKYLGDRPLDVRGIEAEMTAFDCLMRGKCNHQRTAEDQHRNDTQILRVFQGPCCKVRVDIVSVNATDNILHTRCPRCGKRYNISVVWEDS